MAALGEMWVLFCFVLFIIIFFAICLLSSSCIVLYNPPQKVGRGCEVHPTEVRSQGALEAPTGADSLLILFFNILLKM